MPTVVRFVLQIFNTISRMKRCAKQIKLRKDIASELRQLLPCRSVFRVHTFSVLLRKHRMRLSKNVDSMGGEKAPFWTPKGNVELPLVYVKYERLCWIQLA